MVSHGITDLRLQYLFKHVPCVLHIFLNSIAVGSMLSMFVGRAWSLGFKSTFLPTSFKHKGMATYSALEGRAIQLRLFLAAHKLNSSPCGL